MAYRIALGSEDGTIADDAAWAGSIVARGVGLLGRSSLAPGEALIIAGGRQVHTIGMRFPIDVAFCDRDWRVLHVVLPMHPWRISRWVSGTHFIIEAPAGALERVAPGEVLVVTEA